jgi:penicillin-binding protein 1A
MTQRARRRRRGRSPRSVRKKVLLALSVVLAFLLLGAAAGAAWVWSVYQSAPALSSLKPIKKGRSSSIYNPDGSLLGYVHSNNVRQPVPGNEIPADLKQATIAIEDKNFYEHGGIDPSAIIRAGWEDLLAGGKPVQGGSTITQQLVRNLYIANPQETIKRKIIEAHLANEMEDAHSKTWILNKYLNTAPYGTNGGSTAIGVEAAAQTYFNKHAKDLNLDEAAMIAGLPQAPSDYNPFLDPNAALRRRNEVLQAMEQQGYMSQSAYRSAVTEGLGLDPGHKYDTVHQPLIFDFVVQELINRYGINTVREGGLKVYTTIDPRLQAEAQSAVDACAVCYAGGPQSALASVNPANGAILALASSSDYSQQNQFNLAWQGHRQPGSSFKAYVLTTAIKQGIDPESTYYDGTSPITLQLPGGGPPWTVNNAEPGGGVMNLVDATINSVNVVFAQLGLDVGPDNFAKTAYEMGITSPLEVKEGTYPPQTCVTGPNCYTPPADAIGGLTLGVTPLEQADAYATLADGGVHHDATAIGKVIFPNGDVEEPVNDPGNRVLTPGEAYDVTRILEQVITSGTGTPASIGCSTGSAGKTGTSEDESDAWFVGYTPKFSTAVWTGHPTSREYTGFGGPTSGPIWRQFMLAATGGTCQSFPVPSSLPSLSPYYSDHTASAPRTHSYTYTAPSTTSTTTTGSGGKGSGGNYPPSNYAPGIQNPPSGGGGGGTGGGSGGGFGGGGTAPGTG